jgi:glucose-6-phosphate 1-dehydrogenase
MLELLYNHKHKKRRLVVENAFGMNKQNFKELLKKIELDVTICA